ncbi:MAG: YeeE/YedE thiosulfate transporter family protein [Bryobacteraceae bacterium]
MTRLSMRVSSVTMGIVSALLAVAAGTWFQVSPPAAYGICMACHGRDLVNWTINRFAGTNLLVADASLVYPVLTTIGALVGALIASISNGEFRWRTPDHPVKTFLYGMLVMNAALIAGGCSIRLLLRSASGELLGLLGFAGMAVGVALATFWLRWRATR